MIAVNYYYEDTLENVDYHCIENTHKNINANNDDDRFGKNFMAGESWP